MRYVKGTIDNGLVFGKVRSDSRGNKVITGFVDSDFVGCLDSRKSLTGYVFIAFGTAVSWKASLQKVVALSSTEAESIALRSCKRSVVVIGSGTGIEVWSGKDYHVL